MEIMSAMGETDTVCYYMKEEAGVEEIPADFSDMKAYPNPAEDHLYIEFIPLAGQTYQLSLVNHVGQTVKTVELAGMPGKQLRNKLDISDLHPGIYFVNVNCDCGRHQTRKIVIR